MNCDSCELPKNSLTDAITGLMLINCCGITLDVCSIDILSLSLLVILESPILNWLCNHPPTDLKRQFPNWSLSCVNPTFCNLLKKYFNEEPISAAVIFFPSLPIEPITQTG